MNCIFGFFDVLGFTSFCENCETKDAERVLGLIDNFAADIPLQVWSLLGSEAPADKKQLITDRLRWLIFSDTIFVAMPIDESAHPDTLKFNLLFFSILVAYINRRMFELGLPIRGTVDIGDITLSRLSFAGKAIVEAHRFSKKFKVAATVISERASAFVLSRFSPRDAFHKALSGLMVDCEIPTGASSQEKAKTLCWFYLQIGSKDVFQIPADLKGFVTEKFTAHGKTLGSQNEVNKVLNTEKVFRDWRAANFLEYIRPW